jgi:hypothetical protein
MAAVIEALVALSDAEQAFVRSLSDAPITNWNGLTVGRLQASDGLRQALARVAA